MLEAQQLPHLIHLLDPVTQIQQTSMF